MINAMRCLIFVSLALLAFSAFAGDHDGTCRTEDRIFISEAGTGGGPSGSWRPATDAVLDRVCNVFNSLREAGITRAVLMCGRAIEVVAACGVLENEIVQVCGEVASGTVRLLDDLCSSR